MEWIIRYSRKGSQSGGRGILCWSMGMHEPWSAGVLEIMLLPELRTQIIK